MNNSTQSNGLDTEYGENGVAYPHPGIQGITAVVPFGFASIGVGYSFGEYVIFLLDSKGKLGTAFGENKGMTTGRFDSRSRCSGHGVQILSDGRFLMIGLERYEGFPEFPEFPALARFDQIGHLDKSFGDNGHKILEQPSVAKNVSASSASASALPNSKKALDQNKPYMLLSGDKIYVTYQYPDSDAVIFRLDINGNLDTSFNRKGYKYLSPPSRHDTHLTAIHLDGDKILLCGSTKQEGRTQACVIRLNSDGNEDLSFGERGYVFKEYQTHASFTDITIFRKTIILCAGTFCFPWEEGLIAAFTPTGAEDEAFTLPPVNLGGVGGWITVVELPNSLAVVVGSTEGLEEADIIVATYFRGANPTQPFKWFRMSLGNLHEVAWGAAVQSDGKTLVCGFAYDHPESGDPRQRGFILRCLTN